MTKELLFKIKEFAQVNNHFEDEEIKVTAYHPYMAVTNPWMDGSYRFELKNSKAVKIWGLTTVIDFCEKVTALMESNPYFVDIMIKLYKLDADDFENIKSSAEARNTTLERLAFEYTMKVKEPGLYVQNMLEKEEPSFKDVSSAFSEMVAAIL